MRNENETPWPALLGLMVCAAVAFGFACFSAPQNSATRDLIINHLSNQFYGEN